MDRSHVRNLRVLFLFFCLNFLAACTTVPTAVTPETVFQPNEGLFAVRIVDVSNVHLRTLVVASERTAENFVLQGEKFAQSSSHFFIGRLPAGRYKLVAMNGSTVGTDGRFDRRTIPVDKITGKFDVEAQRVTDLGTMSFMQVDGSYQKERGDWQTEHGSFKFLLPLDPTPVPTDQLIAARVPQLAAANLGKSKLGWVPGSVPTQPPGALDIARRQAKAVTQPTFIDDKTMIAGGPLGTMAIYGPDHTSRLIKIDTVLAVESVAMLNDGRMLAGGEEGLLAVTSDMGRNWQRLQGLGSDEIVVHLSQAADGRLLMVTDRDHEAVVYESPADSINWKVIRRIASDRPLAIATRSFNGGTRQMITVAKASRDRLVVYTRPDTLSSLDLKTGKWESYETPWQFREGIKVTPDGYVIGIRMASWVYGSSDYGKNWHKLSTWANQTLPHFFDHKRGIIIAASAFSIHEFRVRTTEDGGDSWISGPVVGAWLHDNQLWANPSGTFWYMTTWQREIIRSSDQGAHWALPVKN